MASPLILKFLFGKIERNKLLEKIDRSVHDDLCKPSLYQKKSLMRKYLEGVRKEFKGPNEHEKVNFTTNRIDYEVFVFSFSDIEVFYLIHTLDKVYSVDNFHVIHFNWCIPNKI